jgi:branched-chain amino acid transport system permease protein
MPDEAAARPNLIRALRETAVTALLAFGLFLPLIGFNTVQNIRNELVLETRWPLLFTFVAILAGLRFLHLVVVAPLMAERARTASRSASATLPTTLPSWTMPAVIGFVLIYPLLAMLIAGPGAGKWIDNFGIQILIYVLLGWGLNIVVGLAGLLDLGYVAFYAIGAYTCALLGKQFDLSFWMLLPLAGILAAFWGVLLGFPVLRLRGDYLAVVTLAFGEIIRLVLINWKDVTQGSAGIGGLPRPTFFGLPFNASPDGFAARLGLEFSPLHRPLFLYYVVLAVVVLTAIVIGRLRRLPVGRAWEALREDEIACRSLGINTTNAKLAAFASGAFFGGLAGALFTARQGFISPESVNFSESALILAIVVLGGLGSTVGVAIAAVVIIGGTELLRELGFLKQIFGAEFDPAQYRMLLFGFAMVLIIAWKPRGFIGMREPTLVLKRRKPIDAELREEHG